jgi:hypothetical protein
MLGIMSSIERWPDNNYTPEALDYVCIVTSSSFQIITRLHGYAVDDVHVDLSRGYIMILITRDDFSLSPEQKEYYCEVPILADARQNVARVEIKGDYLTVSLERNPTSVSQWLTTEVIRLRNGSAQFFGKGRQIRLFDDGKIARSPSKVSSKQRSSREAAAYH